MVSLVSLWLPILVSAVFVFVVSSLMHMLLPYHWSDYGRLPDEDGVMDALRPFAIPPGEYMMPRCTGKKEMNSDDYNRKLEAGPVALMTVYPNGRMKMGAALVQWFIYSLVVSLFSGYIAAHALGAGAQYLAVFRFVGAAAFMGYAMALWQHSIWYKRKWSTTIKYTIDGLIYALVTAGVFGWLWPN